MTADGGGAATYGTQEAEATNTEHDKYAAPPE